MRPLNLDNVDTLYVHCADTPVDMDIGVDEIRRWHADPKPHGNGWSDIGYHYVIRRNGSRELGRSLDYDGAHTYGHNDDSLSVCLVGGKPRANFTLRQYIALKDLHEDVEQMLGRQIQLKPHYAVADRPCPMFDPAALLEL